MFFHKKNPHYGLCLIFHVFVAGLLLFASVAAFIGVFMAHVQVDGLAFGTPSGSLSLLALSICLTLWIYQMKQCGLQCDLCTPPKKK